MSRLIREAAVLAAAAFLASCSGTPRNDSAPGPVSRTLEGLPNARMVGTELLFGGQPTPEALAALVDSLGMRFVSIPMPNPIEGIPDAWVEQFDAVLREAERPMLLHCSSGNRVAGLWAGWLAEKDGMEASRALELGEEAGMTRIRPLVEKRLRAGNP